MGVIKRGEVLGFFDEDGEITCEKCMDKEDWDNIGELDLITENSINRDNDILICDVCKKEI